MNNNISKDFIIRTLRDHYGLNGEVKLLDGEADINYFVKSHKRNFVLKFSQVNRKLEDIELELAILNHINKKNFPYELPNVIATSGGKEAFIIKDENGEDRIVRMMSWVNGKMLGEAKPRSYGLLHQWGQICGHLSVALEDFDHPSAHKFYNWNPSETLHSKKSLKYFSTDEEKEIANYFWDLFENNTLNKLSDFRKSVNYNDAHEMNLLIDGQKVGPKISGVIDFGDALYCETISEIAIACAYGGMHMKDPVSAMAIMVGAYHSIFPLTEVEVKHIFNFIVARLLITVSNAAQKKQTHPENVYLQVSEKPAWNLLRKLYKVSPDLAHYSFRQACGMEPCPKYLDYKKWLSKFKSEIHPIIEIKNRQFVSLDLSVGSRQLGNTSTLLDVGKFEKRIHEMIGDIQTQVGIGGYLEARPIYATDSFVTETDKGFESRTVHLGLDFWTSAGEPIYAPLNGSVYGLEDNSIKGDYGPTLILKHELDDGLRLYTLYGHLSQTVLTNLEVGQKIEKGDVIAHIGNYPINGDWPPHLHFQIILDMLGNEDDFPGVAFPSQHKIWASICPNPNDWIWEEGVKRETIDSAESIMDRRKVNLGRGLSVSYKEPLHIVRGYKQYLFDKEGQRYLDTANNVAHVGHEHERLVNIAHLQNRLLNTNTRYLHQNIVNYAKELVATLPSKLSVVHIVNSGSEANDLALRMIRVASGKKDVVAIESGYHGHTQSCIEVSSYKFNGKGGEGRPEHTQLLPMPDMFRGIYRKESNASNLYALHIKEALDNIKNANRGVAGFIGESILSCGGQIVLPMGYLKAVYKSIRQAGGFCIADEVQTGFGRVGEKFWAFELHDVIPDIVTMGKPIGNGHPLAAIVTTTEVADAFANGMEYFNTYGGNPVSCAIGREVLKIIEDEDLQQNAFKVGNYLLQKLKLLKSKFPIIGDVRGHGLFLGIELIQDMNTLEPAGNQASYLANRMRERGILMSTDGPDHNVIKIKPPMCFSNRDADFLIDNLELILKENFLLI